MPLTPDEIAFLGPTVAEYADIRTGPAWTRLNELGINYRDIVWLMEAQNFIHPPRLELAIVPGGKISEVLKFGFEMTPVPGCPWPDVETARSRNAQIEFEVAMRRNGVTS